MNALRSFLVRFGFVLGLVFSLFAQAPPAEPRNEAFSENKKFSAVLYQTRLDRPTLAVYEHGGDAPKRIWARPLAAEKKEDASELMDVTQFRIRVWNDGSAVILQAQYAHGEEVALRAITKGGRDKSFAMEEFEELMEELLPEVEDAAEFGSQRHGLELLLNDPKLYAIWDVPTASWVALDLGTMKFQAADEGLKKRLNELGLEKARGIARQQQPSALQKILSKVAEKAAAIVPDLALGGGSGESELEEAKAAFRFLAWQKKPEDKEAIERLLEGKPNLSISTTFSEGPGDYEAWLASESWERRLGDELLAAWEGQPMEEEEESEFFPHYAPRLRLHRFGSIAGEVNLPFAAPDQPGIAWIYLIPANTREGAWERSKEIEKVSFDLDLKSMGGQDDYRLERLNFAFDTITPGKYRLKAVWDRRAPFAEKNDEAVAVPGPGDYESAESAVIELAAGIRVGDIELFCTNRSGKADAFYAEDDKWKKEHLASEEEEEMQELPDGRLMKEKVLAGGSGADWVARTNENKGNIVLNRLRLVQSTGPEPEQASKHLEIKFSMPKGKRDEYPSIMARLVDEHGCKFETHGYGSSGRTYEISFAMVPYGATQITLEILRQDLYDENGRPFRSGMRETLLSSHGLSNHFGVKPAEWQADELPAKKDLDIVSVELARFNPEAEELPLEVAEQIRSRLYTGGEAKRAESEFTFAREGKPAKGWHKVAGQFEDRWGNKAGSLAGFCREEELFRYGVEFARDAERAEFLPEEKWEVRVGKIPGAGESVKLGLTNEIQGVKLRLYSIGGTGQFTYRNGELVSAEKGIRESGIAPGLGGQGRGLQPKLVLKTETGEATTRPKRFVGARPASETVILASKIPHLACRVPELNKETHFALLERDLSVEEPMNAKEDRTGFGNGFYVCRYGFVWTYSPVQFLPLDYRGGDTDRTLTFIVQKSRKAEFVLRVPKNLNRP